MFGYIHGFLRIKRLREHGPFDKSFHYGNEPEAHKLPTIFHLASGWPPEGIAPMSRGMTESVRGSRFLSGHKKGRLCVMQNRRSQVVRCASISDVRQTFSSRSINQ